MIIFIWIVHINKKNRTLEYPKIIRKKGVMFVHRRIRIANDWIDRTETNPVHHFSNSNPLILLREFWLRHNRTPQWNHTMLLRNVCLHWITVDNTNFFSNLDISACFTTPFYKAVWFCWLSRHQAMGFNKTLIKQNETMEEDILILHSVFMIFQHDLNLIF